MRVGLFERIAPHSSILAGKIPWTEEAGRLQSMGSQRVGHDWATSLSLFTFMHWRRKWQPTPVFLPGENPRDGEAWWASVYGVAQSQTRPKRLSSFILLLWDKVPRKETSSKKGIGKPRTMAFICKELKTLLSTKCSSQLFFWTKKSNPIISKKKKITRDILSPAPKKKHPFSVFKVHL